jgi:hypothetical protein
MNVLLLVTVLATLAFLRFTGHAASSTRGIGNVDCAKTDPDLPPLAVPLI